jgi:uncharacterized DUF497 family protein
MIFVRRLSWDAWNVAHIARHAVAPEEVEQVCHGDFIIRPTYRGRLLVIGPTLAGRILAAVLDSENAEGSYYVVTARPADRKERATYRLEKGGESS